MQRGAREQGAHLGTSEQADFGDRLPSGGRVWQRIPLDERTLEFSHHVLEFLTWATAEKVHETKAPWDAPVEELTPADELFFWLAFEACRSDPDLVAVLRRKDVFLLNPLCWVTYPGDLVESDEPVPPDFRPSFTGLRAVILECLQTQLTARWLRSAPTTATSAP